MPGIVAGNENSAMSQEKKKIPTLIVPSNRVKINNTNNSYTVSDRVNLSRKKESERSFVKGMGFN